MTLLGSMIFSRGRLTKLAGRAFQLTTQYSHVAGGRERNRHPISGNSSDFDRDVIADVNPFSDFPAKHKHLKLLVHAQNSVMPGRLLMLATRRIAVARCDCVLN
jgi:hypothetical protein